MQLSPHQQRVIGCLLEKQSTTPEHYPLSLNGLTNACNQKSNRDPVLNLTESDVQNALDELIDIRLVTVDEALSGRVNKYDHRFCNTEFSSLQFSAQQLTIIHNLPKRVSLSKVTDTGCLLFHRSVNRRRKVHERCLLNF